MQNNRRDDLKAQTSNLQNRHPTNSTANIPRVSAPQVYPTRVNSSRLNTPHDPTRVDRLRVSPPQRINPDPNARTDFHAQIITNNAKMPTSSKNDGDNKTSLIYPIKLPAAKTPPPKKRKPSKLLDFLLGLVIGFIVFGTAAVFVVRAITEIFV